MNEAEMKEHLDLQSTTIDEQKSTIASQKETLTALNKTVEEMKKTAVTPEELTSLREVQTKVKEFESKNVELQGQLDQISLKEKFPAIKDWSLVKGKDLAEKEEHATKLNEAFGGKPPVAPKPGEKAPEPKPGEDPGEKFKNVGPPGAPSAEMLSQEAKDKKLESLHKGMKEGDLSTVLDECLALQPEKANAIGLGPKK